MSWRASDSAIRHYDRDLKNMAYNVLKYKCFTVVIKHFITPIHSPVKVKTSFIIILLFESHCSCS